MVLATNYEEAMEIYNKYHDNTLGVISDTRFPMKSVPGRLSHVEEGDPEAGLKAPSGDSPSRRICTADP